MDKGGCCEETADDRQGVPGIKAASLIDHSCIDWQDARLIMHAQSR